MKQPMFESFDFRAGYTVEFDPEFPGDGVWREPVFSFDSEGSATGSLEGRGFVIRVAIESGQSWVGTFAGGLGGVTGVFACPSPKHLCLVVDGQAYLVQADTPAEAAVLADMVWQVIPVGSELLLVVSPIDMVAISSAGILWRSERLTLDDLHVVEATPQVIMCTGFSLRGEPENLTLDASTGTLVEGPRLDDSWK